MSFRTSEKNRYKELILSKIFSSNASSKGLYRGIRRDFCINEKYSSENLWEGIRNDALKYFSLHQIPWHDGIIDKQSKQTFPSNHLCCSQSFCINVFFPFIYEPLKLKSALNSLGYEVKEVLPFYEDQKYLREDVPQYVSFEWIGLKNYLYETFYGKVASDEERSRGKGFTSADFAFRFMRNDNKIQIIMGEWKYTEKYSQKSKRISESKTDRLDIYKKFLPPYDSIIKNLPDFNCESLFFDPFDQMMRLQLLSYEMEKNHEMDADIVSVLYIAPQKNRELINNVTSARLKNFGNDIFTIWDSLLNRKRFNYHTTENLLKVLTGNLICPDSKWKSYILKRYNF